MKTSELNDVQLLNYFCEHVRYEIKILLNVTLAINKKLMVPIGLESTPVESFAIHLRNLITFLYPYKKRDNDVCATDFFLAKESWERVRPDLNSVLKVAKARADKEVGHLTTLRQAGTPETKAWDVIKLSAEIMPIVKLFCDSADKVNLDLHFKPIWEYYSSEIAILK